MTPASATIVSPDRAKRDGRAGGAPWFGSGDAVATGRLFLWSAARGDWVSCPTDEITWLDRRLLSGDEDLTLHRAPRCAGLRYVHHRWELFSRDTTHRVYLAPEATGTSLRAEAVQQERQSHDGDDDRPEVGDTRRSGVQNDAAPEGSLGRCRHLTQLLLPNVVKA